MQTVGFFLVLSLFFAGLLAFAEGQERFNLLRTSKKAKNPKAAKGSSDGAKSSKVPKGSKAPKGSKCPKSSTGPKSNKGPKGSKAPKGSTCGGEVVTASPTAVPTTVSPTPAPTFQPTAPLGGWRLGANNEFSCDNVCAGDEPFNLAQTLLVDSEARIRYVYETVLAQPTGATYDAEGLGCSPFYTPDFQVLISLGTGGNSTLETCTPVSDVNNLYRICCCATSAAPCPLGD